MLSAGHLHRKQPLLRVGESLHRAGRRCDGAIVEIDADKIQRRPHLVEVAGLDPHRSLRQERQRFRITPLQRGLEKPKVGHGVAAFGRQMVLFGVGRWLTCRHAECSSHARSWSSRLQRSKTRALCQVHSVRCAEVVENAGAAGSVCAFEIAQVDEGRWFVEQHPVGDAIAQRARHQFDVVGEAGRRIAIGPASGIFERLRQVPVIERDQRADVGFEQGIHETAVVIDAFGIRRTAPVRLNSRPGNREAVAVQIHRPHQRNVFAPAMIGVAGYVAGVAILDFARGVREAVPDGFALAVFFPRAFNLVSGSGGAPIEIPGESNWGSGV